MGLAIRVPAGTKALCLPRRRRNQFPSSRSSFNEAAAKACRNEESCLCLSSIAASVLSRISPGSHMYTAA